MSALVDAQRREDALHARVERCKERLRHFHALLVLELEGLPVADMARRLGLSVSTVRVLRVYVGLDNSLGPLRQRLARAEKREVRQPEVRRQAAQE